MGVDLIGSALTQQNGTTTMSRYDNNFEYAPPTLVPPTPPKKRRVWPFLVALVLLGLCAAGVLISLGNAARTPVPSIGQVTTPARSVPPGMIQEGTWIVGTDVKPGKYQTLGPTDSRNPLCYWDVRIGSESNQITVQGVKTKMSAKGYVTLNKGEYFTTSGCSDWTLVATSSANISWTPKAVPVSQKKVYVVKGSGLSGWPVASAEAFIDRYTGSNWVMASRCPAAAYRCVFVKKDNGLRAPVLAATYGYNTSRVTIRVDVAYANSRHITSQAKRKNILAHEFGHAGFLHDHSPSCGNLMYAHTNCLGWSLTKGQKATLRKH